MQRCDLKARRFSLRLQFKTITCPHTESHTPTNLTIQYHAVILTEDMKLRTCKDFGNNLKGAKKKIKSIFKISTLKTENFTLSIFKFSKFSAVLIF